MMFILEVILTICVFIGACAFGSIMGLAGLYIYATIKERKSKKEWNNRYYNNK